MHYLQNHTHSHGLFAFQNPEYQSGLLWLCTMLSYSVLALTFWYKGPQVYAVLSSGSSLGISMPSLLLEFTSYSIEMTYQGAMAYPLETYFDIIFMWAQDVILLYIVLANRNLVTRRIIPPIIIYITWFFLMITRNFPDIVMFSFIASTTVIITASKSIQLWEIFETKNPGSLSALSWGLLSYMAFARIITTTAVQGDILVLMNTTSATFLDLSVALSIIYYNKVKERRMLWRRANRNSRSRSNS